ncbi:MAG: hypothetical protein ACRDL3_11015 [Solirubrobacterales bacterium]
MSIRIGPHQFENVDYDAEHDILYAWTGAAQATTGEPMEDDGTSTFNYTVAGKLVGVDLFDARRRLERGGTLVITLPNGQKVEAEGVEAVVGQPAA